MRIGSRISCPRATEVSYHHQCVNVEPMDNGSHLGVHINQIHYYYGQKSPPYITSTNCAPNAILEQVHYPQNRQ